MKAVVCRSFDGIDAARLEYVEAPKLEVDQVRVRVHACAASFASLLVIQGKHQNRMAPPFTPGTEIAGEVIETTDTSGRFSVGDRIVACVKSGGYATEAVVPTRSVFALPDGVPYGKAAHFPTIYATAYGAFVWRAGLKSNDWVLVHGGAGGSGLAAIQVATALGARVIATAGSQAKRKFCEVQGATKALDYNDKDWPEQVLALTGGRGTNIIYDPVGGEIFDRSMKCIAPDGKIIPMGFASGEIPVLKTNIALVKNISVIGFYWGYYVGWAKKDALPEVEGKVREAFKVLFGYYLDGSIKPITHELFSLSDFKQALVTIQDRNVMGRVIMTP